MACAYLFSDEKTEHQDVLSQKIELFLKVDVKIFVLFYDSVVVKVWRYCLLYWGGNASKGGLGAGGMYCERSWKHNRLVTAGLWICVY